MKYDKSKLQKIKGPLAENQVKDFLKSFGIKTTKYQVVKNSKELDEINISYPVVLKVCSNKILHKTDSGLINLNNTNPDMVTKNFNEIKKRAGKDIPILVQQMIQGKREFVAGMTKFSEFGNCILFGIGGIFTEAFNDNSIRVAPINTSESEEMIYDIKAKKLLGEYRGMEPVDIKTLTKIIETLGNISLLHREPGCVHHGL